MIRNVNVATSRVDQYFEGTRDFLSPYIPMGFMSTEEAILKGIQEKTSPKYLPIFERVMRILY